MTSPKQTASAAPGQPATHSQRFSAFLEAVYQQNLASSPQMATEVGSKLGDDRWDDISEAALAREAARIRENINTARKDFELEKLDAAAQLQYRVFMEEQQLLLDRYRWRDHLYPLNQIVGLHLDIPDTLTGAQPLDDEADAAAYVRRIRAAGPTLHTLVERMRSGAKRGFYMPKPVYPLLVEGAQNVISGAPYTDGPDSQILADFKRRVGLLSIPAERKKRFIAGASDALRRDLQPAYTELITVLKEQGARTPITAGVWQLPDGDAFYRFLVRQFTTTGMTPADIHALGLQQVAKVHRPDRDGHARSGFNGSVREFMAKTKADPRFYNANTDAGRECVSESRARQSSAPCRAHIPEAFLGSRHRCPWRSGAPKPTRKLRHRRASTSPGHERWPPSRRGVSQPVRHASAADCTSWRICCITKACPAITCRSPPSRRTSAFPECARSTQWWQDTAFVEGWGLYAEQLGKDMGFYQDPYSDLGRLTGELWRACRLVVDSGLHYKHWSREQAIHYLQENSAAPDGTIVREVDRYMAVPGQATAFTVGMLKFVSERERARQGAGSRIRSARVPSHRVGVGYLPLWAVEDRVTRWIAMRQGQGAAQ